MAGGYELLALIGRGGMATVHLGRRPGSDSYVAIKTVHADGFDDEASAVTLHDEARVLSLVRHTNVVPLLEVLRAEGSVLLVMPYVRGASLAELMIATSEANQVLAPGVVSAIAQDVLAGLDAAHTARAEDGTLLRVVHRDVSPQNVMVGLDGVAKVLDFGIAKSDGRAAKTTRDGTMKGKVAYMAPEQIHGEEADLRADLYAVGVITWEMLALDRLFAGANDADTLRRVLMAPVENVSSLRDDVPAGLDEWLARAVARSRGARFASAREMARALEAILPRAGASEVERAMAPCVARIAQREPRPRSLPPPAATPVVSNYPPAATVPPAARKAQRWLLPAFLVALVGLVALFTAGLFASRDARPPPALAAASPTGTSLAAGNPGATFEVPETAPLPVPSVAPFPHPPAKKRATPLPPNCAVPYTVDHDGRKKYRAECLP